MPKTRRPAGFLFGRPLCCFTGMSFELKSRASNINALKAASL
jgi:hypothetical protein